jgi:bifunctional UDP-N-acetylglucosamine pyrophosphorylase/glucosamine-1-phosphate N-acetyltransferase
VSPLGPRTTCAIVPAAGRGTRLGLHGPKLLTPVTAQETVWTLLRRTLAGLVDQVHVVVSPTHFDAVRAATPPDDLLPTTFAVQDVPTGMGDAVFRGWSEWKDATSVVVIWGDQVHVSRETIARGLRAQAGAPRRVVVPLVRLAEPYVEYRFDDSGRLTEIRQTREGDRCQPGGWGDVGTFVLPTGGLLAEWQHFRAGPGVGARTGEVNFLPFLTHLAAAGWAVRPSRVDDPREARGINTTEDLAYFRSLYRPA